MNDFTTDRWVGWGVGGWAGVVDGSMKDFTTGRTLKRPIDCRSRRRPYSVTVDVPACFSGGGPRPVLRPTNATGGGSDR